jgi:heme/copper-type cytochrome/quinol oxidase subunit 2
VPEFSMKLNIAKGYTGNLEFQAQKTGEFSFYCPSCENTASGLIKVYSK